MITVTEHALQHMNFNPQSPLGAVQAVREMMTDGTSLTGGKGVGVINKLLGLNLSYASFIEDASTVKEDLLTDYELMVTQAVAEQMVKNVGVSVDEVEVLTKAKARAMRLLTSPQHAWMFAKPEATASGQPTTDVAVAAGIELKVAVKADGSIKKGGKELLAIALYEKHVKNAATPLTNQEFIAVLVKELGMSKAGATTYNYNMKKKFGGTITPKGKKA
jgi:hypothetical protein